MGNNHMFKKSGFWLILLLFLSSCQKDDVKQEHFHHFSNEKLNHKIVTATDIPEVMQFLRANASPDLKFLIQTGGISGELNKSGEPDLIITELNTEQVIAVTNESNLTNYSFYLRVDTEPYYEGEVSFFNLIVKETTAVEEYYAYIQEYRMNENWYVGNESILDMHSYTGKMIFYTIEGVYVAKLDFSDGRIIGEDLRSPCPDPGSGSGGDGGDPGTGPGPGDGGTGGTGSGNINVSTVNCTGGPNHPPGHPDCQCGTTDMTCLPGYWIVHWGSEIHEINETLNNPCCDPPCEEPVDCNYPNGDPCPCNTTNDGCVEENPNVGVIHITHPDCQQLLKISNHTQTRTKIQNLRLNYLNYTIEYGFNLFENSQEDVNSTDIAPGTSGHFYYSSNPVVFGGVHTHQSNNNVTNYPLFSMSDVLTLYQFYNNFQGGGGNISKPTHILVSEHGVFALKIENLAQFQNFVNNSDFVKLNEQILRRYDHIRNQNPFSSTIPYQRRFLQAIQNAGVSLYQANQDLTGWTKIVLNKQGQPQQTSPCNF